MKNAFQLALITALLTGCTAKSIVLPPKLLLAPKRPEMSAVYRTPCYVPPMKLKDDGKAILARSRDSLRSCAAAKAGLVKLYDRTR